MRRKPARGAKWLPCSLQGTVFWLVYEGLVFGVGILGENPLSFFFLFLDGVGDYYYFFGGVGGWFKVG